MIVICGPTASGKSRAAKILAKKLGQTAIINADSMQVYSGIEIITDSPSEQDKKEIPHKLYNYIKLSDDTYSVARYISDSKASIDKCLEESIVPIIVGGTGMYIKSLLYGMDNIPDVPKAMVKEISDMLREEGFLAFKNKISNIHPHFNKYQDPQRLIRAYCVYIHTGKLIEEFYTNKTKGYNCKVIYIKPERDILYERCNKRMEEMLSNGGLDEIKHVIKLSALHIKAIGIKEISCFLSGEINYKTAVEKAKQATRNYAKRQITWFNNQINADYILKDFAEIDKIDINSLRIL